MPKKSTTKRKRRMKRRVSYDQELAQEVSVNNLILFGIYSVDQGKERCTFERLVKKCFTLFPKVFSFSKTSRWPDSRKLDRPLRALRRKDLITGSPKNSFALTAEGKKIALDIARAFRQRKLL